ncbi:fasciclin-like arabinogalactan protein 11 [Cajanus cajan]|uniref:Fasciclin-like arabinogalactan protein 11 n=1 Tax=Cajanus cajan TaxID=3821 RepID=A0A151RVD5_CAJCA|nr:fasciclin-like arabinogalactan protein 11 [Cajanus cajan]KYP46518.1 Fasciclin-like arabinogalactan protein 11 [Cajanus cajan]
MRIMQESQSLIIPITILLLLALFYTTSAQLSPIQPPTTSPSPPSPPLPQASPPSPAVPTPPATAPAPGFNTVPLVPVTPSGAPTPASTIPKGPTIDIVQILRKAKRFSVLTRLLKTTQLINQLNSQLVTSGSGGLTLFAPEDSAFSKLKAGFLNSLTDRQKVELLQFHTLSSYLSISNFDTLTNPVQTQAGDDPQRLQLNVTTYGGSQVSMPTGAVNASVTGTVYSDNKLAIYQVDKVLLPLDLVLPSKAPAPAPSLAKKGLPKSDKGNGTAADDSAGGGDDGSDGKALPADVSAGCSMKWVNNVVVVGVVGLMGGVMM